MFDKIGIQFYSVRNHMTDEAGVRYTFDRLVEIGYKEVQTSGAFTCEVEKFAEKLAGYGMKFSYHNHSHEFARVPGGDRVIDYMVDGFDKNNVKLFLIPAGWQTPLSA